ncbi:MAG: acyl-ACP--UDP-N-acetylglucosamine O-acyltransferase [Gemmatimonadaceae bacterium]|nr:acyl-ACP--UDP-N-acetylglucosamine O-acyltransferase [Gemmatimonadaceae bacterium]
MTSSAVHPSAVISPGARLGKNVSVGPFAIIGDGCEVGDGCVIAPHAMLERNVKLAANVKVGVGTVLGGEPQDLKFGGEETTVEIGEGTTIREYTTINRGTTHSFKTSVGKNCLLMSYVHLAHDCQIGDGVILSNVVQLAGHVIVDDRAIISGLTAVHQFVRIGRHSFIGGCSRVSKDIPPFLKAVGNPVKLYGLNTIGLQRGGFSEEVLRELKRAYRLFFRSDLNVSQAMQRATEELEPFPEVQELVKFVEASERGVVV